MLPPINTPSTSVWISCQADRQHQRHLGWFQQGKKNKGTPKSGISEHLLLSGNCIHLLKWCVLWEIKSVFLSVLFSAAIMRRTVVCDHYILISVRIWAGGGYISLRVTMPTSAPVPVLTSAAQTQPTAQWDKLQRHNEIIDLFDRCSCWTLSLSYSCWASTTPWTPKRPPRPAVFLRTWSPSPSFTMWVAPRKSSSSPIWLSSPASAAKPQEIRDVTAPSTTQERVLVVRGGVLQSVLHEYLFPLLQPCLS